MRSLLMSCLSLLLLSSAQAKNYAFFLGGGEAPAGSNTLAQKGTFDTSLVRFSEFAKIKSWQTEYYYGQGSNSYPVNIVEIASEQKHGFSNSDYIEFLKSARGTIDGARPGDQILIFISTHGLPPADINRVTEHRITTSGDSTSIDTQELEALIKYAESKNIQIALVDTTCYSGFSLKLASEKTCVLAGASDKNTAYLDFGETLLQQMQLQGSNLESAYLQSRSQLISPADPQISTREGFYLYKTTSILQNYGVDATYSLEQQLKRDSPFRDNTPLDVQLKDLSSLIAKFNIGLAPNMWGIDYGSSTQQYLFDTLRKKMQAYSELRLAFERAPQREMTSVCDPQFRSHCIQYFLIEKSLAERKKALASAIQRNSVGEISENQAFVDFYQSVKNSDDYKNWQTEAAKIQNYYLMQPDPLYKIAVEIMRLERLIYKTAYTQMLTQERSENACAQFKL